MSVFKLSRLHEDLIDFLFYDWYLLFWENDSVSTAIYNHVFFPKLYD